MLYNYENGEDEELEAYEEYERKRIKRKIKLISTLTIIAIVLLGSFLLTHNYFKNKQTDNRNEQSDNAIESNVEESQKNVSENNSEIKNDLENNNDENNYSTANNSIISAEPTKNLNKNAQVYIGTHMQIPVHLEENIKKGFVPGENPNAQEEIKQIYSSNEKQVYLTFDDGPSKEITPKILDVLKAEDVTATFFVLGSRVELNPSLVQREFNEGHFIANHGYSHKYSQIYSSIESVYDEYIKCEKAVQTALNNTEYHTRLFRFPGGSSGGKYNDLKAEAKKNLTARGIASTNWNSLTGDAEGITDKEKLINRMITTKGNSNSVILLMHDAGDKSYTLEALPDIIKYFKEQGYVFKNFYEIFNK